MQAGTIPEIAKGNPGVKPPNDDIVVIHRSDGSGTTYYLDGFSSPKASADFLAEQSRRGRGCRTGLVGLGGKGNEGVTGLVKQTSGSIGYVEGWIYAVQNNILYGNVQERRRGKYVKASLAGVDGSGWRSGKGYAR